MSNPIDSDPTPTSVPNTPGGLSEDWTAVVLGILVVVIALGVALLSAPAGLNWESPRPTDEAKAKGETIPSYSWNFWAYFERGSEVKKGPYIGKLGTWNADPRASLLDSSYEKVAEDPLDGKNKEVAKVGENEPTKYFWPGILGSGLVVGLIGGLAQLLRRKDLLAYMLAFVPLFLLVVFSYVLASQSVIKNYNLEYALWALLIGMVLSNTVGVPQWLKPAVQGELYIKTGLVLLGTGVLFGKLLAMGIPGIMVAWVVTPIVLIATYIFGQKVLKIESPSLNMVISADMSVCGVSAAIATAAACKAKKDELSMAVGLSLSFTAVMMVVMPWVIQVLNIDPIVGGAWMGGTIDATGAVAAAGAMLPTVENSKGIQPVDAAVTIKMIQNILIGVTAFCVAIYWATVMERGSIKDSKVGVGEIWKRFPKFVIGFLAVSIAMSLLTASSYYGDLWVNSMIKGVAKTLQGWLFCFAFVSIGLETNFRQLFPYFKSGKPMVLYVVGQSFNLLLTFAMAYLMFGVLGKWFRLY